MSSLVFARICRELVADMAQVVIVDALCVAAGPRQLSVERLARGQPDSGMTSRAVARYKPVATSVVVPR